MKRDKASISKGMFMMRDGPGRAAVKYGASPPPRYGAPEPPKGPSLAEIARRIEDARKKLDELKRARLR